MILRKPYAFLIKHFRLLHLILLACLIFIIGVFNDIHRLFVTMHSTSMYMYVGAMNHVNSLIYLIIVFGLVVSLILYILLRNKKKPYIVYFILIVDFILNLIVTAYLYSTLKIIEVQTINVDKIIFVKDISFAVTLPIYVLIVICFIRGIGFNMKQFNFSKDIQDLQIADKDSEEFELLIGKNNYKYMRKIRRTIRELKYYALENLYSLMVIGGGILVILSGFGIYYYNQHLKRLAEEEANAVGTIVYSVNSSYITKNDYLGNEINKDKKYVVVNMTFGNMLKNPQAVDLSIISLYDGNNSYQPTMIHNTRFYDLGTPLTNDALIGGNSTITATLCFEIPAKVRKKNFELRVQYKVDTSFLKDYVAEYRKFDINALDIDSKDIEYTKGLNDPITVDVVGKNEFMFNITKFEFSDTYENRFVTCKSIKECGTKVRVVSPNHVKDQTMLVLDFKGKISDDANFTKTLNTYNKIFNAYTSIEYVLGRKTFVDEVSVVNGSDVTNKVFINVSRKLLTANKIKMIFNFRNEKYVINLK